MISELSYLAERMALIHSSTFVIA